MEDYLEFVSADVIRLRGHRIGLEHIVAWYSEGYTAEEIAQEYSLAPVQVYAAITYYLVHQAEVDATIARHRREDEQAYQQWAADPPMVARRLRAWRDKKASKSD